MALVVNRANHGIHLLLFISILFETLQKAKVRGADTRTIRSADDAELSNYQTYNNNHNNNNNNITTPTTTTVCERDQASHGTYT